MPQLLMKLFERRRHRFRSDESFDFASEEEKRDYELKYPDVEEYDKEILLVLKRKYLVFI